MWVPSPPRVDHRHPSRRGTPCGCPPPCRSRRHPSRKATPCRHPPPCGSRPNPSRKGTPCRHPGSRRHPSPPWGPPPRGHRIHLVGAPLVGALPRVDHVVIPRPLVGPPPVHPSRKKRSPVIHLVGATPCGPSPCGHIVIHLVGPPLVGTLPPCRSRRHPSRKATPCGCPPPCRSRRHPSRKAVPCGTLPSPVGPPLVGTLPRVDQVIHLVRPPLVGALPPCRSRSSSIS